MLGRTELWDYATKREILLKYCCILFYIPCEWCTNPCNKHTNKYILNLFIYAFILRLPFPTKLLNMVLHFKNI